MSAFRCKAENICSRWAFPVLTRNGHRRIFKDDNAEDTKAIQTVLGPVMFYPLSQFNGKYVRCRDERSLAQKRPEVRDGGSRLRKQVARLTRWV
jgi:hypothetical protein